MRSQCGSGRSDGFARKCRGAGACAGPSAAAQVWRGGFMLATAPSSVHVESRGSAGAGAVAPLRDRAGAPGGDCACAPAESREVRGGRPRMPQRGRVPASPAGVQKMLRRKCVYARQRVYWQGCAQGAESVQSIYVRFWVAAGRRADGSLQSSIIQEVVLWGRAQRVPAASHDHRELGTIAWLTRFSAARSA